MQVARARWARLAGWHLPVGAPAHPVRRHPAHVSHIRIGARARRGPSPPLPACFRQAGRAAASTGRLREGRWNRPRARHIRDGDAIPVRARRPGTSRQASARAQRGGCCALAFRPGQISHRQLLGRLPRAASSSTRPSAAEGCDPRQRRRHCGARIRPLLPGYASGRGGDRRPYIPFYLTTHEFFALARSRLTPGGVVLVNVGHPEGDNRLEQEITATMRSVFPTVLRDPWTPPTR
jgi:hypothetical protein